MFHSSSQCCLSKFWNIKEALRVLRWPYSVDSLTHVPCDWLTMKGETLCSDRRGKHPTRCWSVSAAAHVPLRQIIWGIRSDPNRWKGTRGAEEKQWSDKTQERFEFFYFSVIPCCPNAESAQWFSCSFLFFCTFFARNLFLHILCSISHSHIKKFSKIRIRVLWLFFNFCSF